MSKWLDSRDETLSRGDHLIVYFGCYFHHGIDLGDGRVVHFGRGLFDWKNAKVEVVDRQTFSQGKPIRLGNSEARFNPQTICERALSMVGRGDYNVWWNNCEHFVTWCRSGEPISVQSQLVQSGVRQVIVSALKAQLARGAPAPYRFANSGTEVVQFLVEAAVAGPCRQPKLATVAGHAAAIFMVASTSWIRGGPLLAAAQMTKHVACQAAASNMVKLLFGLPVLKRKRCGAR